MTGRYDALPVLTRAGSDGRTVKYLARRLLGQPIAPSAATAYRVSAGERADLIAAVTLGDAELSWAIADANAVARPSDLEQPGSIISVPVTPGLGVRNGL